MEKESGMEIITHLKIDAGFCGTALETRKGFSKVQLTTTPAMVADEKGLVHGGFIFGMADYAAMIAVNDPNVVLGAADVRFLKPVALGETVVAEARVSESRGKKHMVFVQVRRDDTAVFEGTFTCFVLEQHVLA
jgi:acyl-coenzyme A thioesterase PaaI-like protein